VVRSLVVFGVEFPVPMSGGTWDPPKTIPLFCQSEPAANAYRLRPSIRNTTGIFLSPKPFVSVER